MRQTELTDLRSKVGKMLSKHRKNQDLSMGMIADQLGVARSTVHNIEHGKMACHFEIVVAYAGILGPKAIGELNGTISRFKLRTRPAPASTFASA